jgi:hypothetical protein
MRCSLVLLACLLNSAFAAPVRELTWDEASQFNGKSIRLIMPGGAAVTGKVIALEPQSMVLRVTQTADAKEYPKGELRIPRDTLRTFEVNTKSKQWRVLGTTLGFVAGTAAAAGIQVSGGVLAPSNTGRDIGSVAVFAALRLPDICSATQPTAVP